MLSRPVQWFHSFATEGLALPAFMTGFGSLVILRASSTPMLTEDQIAAVPRWLRWLARKDSETLMDDDRLRRRRDCPARDGSGLILKMVE
jgi:hypothetical protein